MNNKPLFFIVLCIVLFSFKRSKDKLINAPKYFGSPVYNFKENPLSKEKMYVTFKPNNLGKFSKQLTLCLLNN